MGDPWTNLAVVQEGTVARRQLLAMGLSSRQARRHVDNGRWQVALPGVYIIHTGPPTAIARIWAAVLYCGDGAVAGGRTALGLAQALPRTGPIEICIPHRGGARAVPGISVHRVRDLFARSDRFLSPPRLRTEHAVLDVADREESPEAVCGLVLGVLQRRLTTSRALSAALSRRSRHRWRGLVDDLLAEFTDGVQSPLERRYLRDVERAHRLPPALRNVGATEPDGRQRHRDVRYEKWRLIVELDGQEAHPRSDAFRDMRRDNVVVADRQAVLRHGWRDVAGRPCAVAAQVSAVLAAYGWRGRARPCGPACPVGRTR
ncbi:hypothetical protein GCM10022223_08110 [Kineosporia mesophila]|uniref:Transcriptional regulator, AbiEi antitoxin, Type IV TA system n=1 Tax=Kineosporia mesophila TaxID=566012 RepID=A0ABP6Z2G4_9ACTN|nr:hypothetical protein [Kineosporia mesophila]MCD5351189.1 hypothetical protein [Kineosporia mesophila]